MTSQDVKELLIELSKKWYDKGVRTENEWYNDASAYYECSDDLDRLVDLIEEK